MMAAAAVMLCACGSSTPKETEAVEEDSLLIEEVVDEAEEIVEEAVEEVQEVKEEVAPVQEVAKEEPKVDNKAAWDKWLDEYDAFVDDYVEVYKKSQSNDLKAMAELAEMAVKLERIQKNMPGEEEEMTTSQMARYGKISAKMAKGMQ